MTDELNKNITEENDSSDDLYERFAFTIDRGQEPLRIDKFLMTRIEGATRNKIQQAIDNEMVLVNEKTIKSNYKIRPLDKVVVYTSRAPEGTEIIPENIPLNIHYEDDAL